MSAFGNLLEREREAVLRRWASQLHEPPPSERVSPAEVRDHVPLFLRELAQALDGGHVPTTSPAAIEHGRQREELGFDVDAVVQEYGILMEVVLDLAEEAGLAPSILELRIVMRLFSLGITESIASYRRHQEDVSRRLVVEAQAREAEIQSVIDALPVLVSFVTADARYGLVNRAYEDWFKLSRGDLHGRRVEDVIGSAAWAKLGPAVERGLAGERFSFEQHGVPYVEAGIRDVAISFVPRRTAAGAAEGYVALVEDITARRLLETERERLLVAERRARRDAEIQRIHLAALVANAPIGIATWRGPEHVFDSANELYLALTQRDRSVIGQPIRSAFAEVPPDHPVFAIWDEVYRSGAAHVDPEYRVSLLVDGRLQERTFLFHLTAIRDPEGEIDGLMACFSDVTEVTRLRELVEVERDLATAVAELETSSRVASDEARARTEFLLTIAAGLGESLDLDVVLKRLVATIAPAHAMLATLWSVAPLRRRVHAPEMPALTDPSSVLGAENDLAVSSAVRAVLASGETLRIDDYEAWMTAAGAPEVGRSFAAQGVRSALVLPIRRGAEVIAVVAVARGHTAAFSDDDVAVFELLTRLTAIAYENARLFGEMAQLRNAAEEATVAKDRFLAHVSHDLRNPLSSILGWSSLLREMPDAPAQMKRGIEVIERNAKSQQQLIEDLLDVSRITSGKLSLVMAVEDVRSAIESALDAARLAAVAKKVNLVVAVDDEIGAIAVDPDRFRQIVWNLVSNAVKFTPTGGVVRIDARRIGPILRLVVEDSGRGIAPAFLPRVFDTFEQAEAGARRTGGLGLGLAIAKKLVELHRGTIRVESEGEGKGARFTIDLPIRASIEPVAEDGRAPLAGIRLLVVDDEEEARDVITLVLEHAGATVTGCASVDDALDVFLRMPLDAVVSDIAMPGRDGKDLVREIRTLPVAQGGSIPVVALTAFVSRRDRQEILAAGFDAHVAKPVEPPELIGTLAGLLGRKLGP